MAAGAAGLMAAGIVMAKKMSDEAAKHGDADGGSGESGLTAIQAHDPGFEKTAFIADAEKSFFLIQKAWCDQDPDQFRQGDGRRRLADPPHTDLGSGDQGRAQRHGGPRHRKGSPSQRPRRRAARTPSPCDSTHTARTTRSTS